MSPPSAAELHALRFVVMDTGYKAAGQVAVLMLDALREQHPDRTEALHVALSQGMQMAVQFRFRFDEPASALLQLVDDYGTTTNLAEVGVVITERDKNAKAS